MDLRDLNRAPEEFYVIAEIGNNHGGSENLCRELFLEAKLAGASAVKLQARNNKSLFTPEFYNSPYDNPNSFGRTYGEHREAVELSHEQLLSLNNYAEELGIDFICTAFDLDSAEFIARSLRCSHFKLASSDLCNITLLDFLLSLDHTSAKPLILSSGGATFEDMAWSLEYLSDYKPDITLLHCVSSYPARHELINLNVIPRLMQKFGNKATIGYSSHDNGVSVPLMAASMGAKVIEKHFTLNRSAKGTDHPMSANPTMLRNLVRDLKYLTLALGDGNKIVHDEERIPLRKMMKSPYFARDIIAGTILQPDHVLELIPFTGVTSRDLYESMIGKVLKRDVKRFESINAGDLT